MSKLKPLPNTCPPAPWSVKHYGGTRPGDKRDLPSCFTIETADGNQLSIRCQRSDACWGWGSYPKECDTDHNGNVTADRIVACINACRGLPTKHLEQLEKTNKKMAQMFPDLGNSEHGFLAREHLKTTRNFIKAFINPPEGEGEKEIDEILDTFVEGPKE